MKDYIAAGLAPMTPNWIGANASAKMNIDMLCPQHGAIFQGQDVDTLYQLAV